MTALEDTTRPFRLEWGWMLLRGLLALALGVFGFTYPKLTIVALTSAWSAYAIVDGILALVFARRAEHLDLPGWPSILIGMLGIFAGLLTFLEPKVSTISLVIISCAWALGVGTSEVITSIRLHKQITNERFLGLAGATAIGFGIFVLAQHLAGAQALTVAISTFAILTGACLVMCALRIRDYEHSHFPAA